MPQNKQWIIAFSIIDQSSTTTYASATVIQFISAIYAFFCILSLQRFKKFCTCKGIIISGSLISSFLTSYNMRVVVFKVPLQELEEKCYTVTDAVDRYVYLPQDGFKEAPTTALYEFVN